MRKGHLATILLSIVSLTTVFPLAFIGEEMNVKKVDVYYCISHLRWPENIAYDISEIITIIVLTYTVYILMPEKRYKRYARSFLIVSSLGLPSYFLIYNMYVSMYFMPTLLVMLILNYINNKYNVSFYKYILNFFKNGNAKRNNVR